MNYIQSLNLIICVSFWIIMPAHITLGQTSSPFTPPAEKLGGYVINSGPGLDTGCTFRSGGPLIVKLALPATVNHNEINSDGSLKDPKKLVNSGLLSAQAIIRFPVYDIDSDPSTPGFEVDRVSFNGKFKKILEGRNNTWTDDSLVVPIDELLFKSINSPDAINELRVDIDTGNVGRCECWCMAIDWVYIQFESSAPYVLVHGINSDKNTWNENSSPGALNALNQRGVLYSLANLTSNGSSYSNARQLLTFTENFLQTVKSQKVHIIAHSKGGLDSQYLKALGPPFEILTLSTLATPHLGSVSADLAIIQQAKADEAINSGNDPNEYAEKYINSWTFGLGPQLPGLFDLTTYRAVDYLNKNLRGNIKNTFTYGADADINGNNILEPTESAGFINFNNIASRIWRVTRDFTEAKILEMKTTNNNRRVLVYKTIEASSPQPNDIVVTLKSANPPFGISVDNSKNHHSSIKNGRNINLILDYTIPYR